MLRSKPVLAIGLAALLPLITTGITTWTATLESVAGSGISGTALVEAPNGNPSMSTSDSTGRFDSMPVFQSDSARALNRSQTSSRGVPMATHASISISGAQPGEYLADCPGLRARQPAIGGRRTVTANPRNRGRTTRSWPAESCRTEED